MSATTIKLVHKDGIVRPLRNLSNAMGFANAIWGPMCVKYLGVDEFAWIHRGDIAQKVWDLEHDPRLPRHWKVTLIISFDHAIIEPDKFTQAAEDLTQFCRESEYSADKANNLPAIIWALGQKHEYPDCRGMCFRGTTVGHDLWTFPESKSGPERPYNIDKDFGHFFVYERLGRNERQATH